MASLFVAFEDPAIIILESVKPYGRGFLEASVVFVERDDTENVLHVAVIVDDAVVAIVLVPTAIHCFPDQTTPLAVSRETPFAVHVVPFGLVARAVFVPPTAVQLEPL